MAHINAKTIKWEGVGDEVALVNDRYMLTIDLMLAGWAWSVKDRTTGTLEHGFAHGIPWATKADAKMAALKALHAMTK